MQPLLRTFFLLYLGHLLTDFVFQTECLVERKKRGAFGAYIWHGVIYYAVAVSLLGYFVHSSILTLRTHLVLLGLTIAHLIFDFTKAELTRKQIVVDGFWTFISDQVAHLITIVVSAWLISPTLSLSEAEQLIENSRNIPNKVLIIPMVYAAVIFGGGYLIRFMTKGLMDRAENQARVSAKQLLNAGLYIGWLERFLVLTALLLHAPATVGLILTAKSIARYPEFKSESFAEYFLIGTLLSISIALLAGILLLKLLFGKVQLSG